MKEKTYILGLMKEVADAVADKDSEKSENRMKILAIAGGVATAVIAILGSTLGGNISLAQGDDEDVIDVDDFEEIE